LPTLRFVNFKRSLGKSRSLRKDKTNDQMPTMRQSERSQKRTPKHASRKGTTLSLPRVWPSVFWPVEVFLLSSLFSVFLKLSGEAL
jgi:hypothetical protein